MALISSLEKDKVDSIALEVYEKFEKDSGKVPEWVKVMAHRPEILKEFTELFKAIMGQGKIESMLKWKMAFVVSETLKCPFCVSVTKKMLKQLGAEDETIEEIKNLSAKEDNDLLSLVKDVTLDGHLDQPELFEKLKENFDEPQIVEIVCVIGLFNFINRFNNTLAVLPE